MAERDISRRQFLKTACFATAAVAVGGGIASAVEGCNPYEGIDTTVDELVKGEDNISADLEVKFNDVIAEGFKIIQNTNDDTAIFVYKIYDPNRASQESNEYCVGIDFSKFALSGDHYTVGNPKPLIPGQKIEGELKGTFVEAKNYPQYSQLNLGEHFVLISGFKEKK